MWKKLTDLFDIQDVFTYGGLVLVGVGCGMVYLPAGFIAGGVGLMGIGLRWFIRERKPETTETEEV